MHLNKFVAFVLIVASLAFTEPVWALPTRGELRTQRVQLERLRRYVIFMVGKTVTTEESAQKAIAIVVNLDVKIMEIVYTLANYDELAAAEMTLKKE
jgi:hypothetical protein